MIDGEELGVVADRAGVEAASPEDRGRAELFGDFGGGGSGGAMARRVESAAAVSR